MRNNQHRQNKHPVIKLHGAWHGFIISLGIVILVLLQLPKPALAKPPDEPCKHGMRIVGEKAIYLSHMGLFNDKCHSYQGLFEVSFEGPNNPQQIYLNAQRESANQNEFTIEPIERFVLPKLAAGNLTSFRAKIHRGQYERQPEDSKLLAGNVTVRIKRVVFFSPFQPGTKRPPLSEYLLFGSESEQLAAHKITTPPDFDQIVALKTPLPLGNTDLVKAVRIVLPNRPTPDSKANLKQLLKPGDKPAVQVDGRQPTKAIEVGIQYFVETDDYQG